MAFDAVASMSHNMTEKFQLGKLALQPDFWLRKQTIYLQKDKTCSREPKPGRQVGL